MNITAQDTIAIASIYLALIGLMSTLYFLQLGQWLSSIQAMSAKWLVVKKRSPGDAFEKQLECYYEAVHSSSPWTGIGWFGIAAFLVIVGVFLEDIRRQLDPVSSYIVWWYISLPCYIFLSVYLLLSLAMLYFGYCNAFRVRIEAKAKLN